MPLYSVPRVGVTPNGSSQDDINILTTSTGVVRVLDIWIGGEATVNTINRMQFRRHTVNGVTNGVAITPIKMHPRSNPSVAASTLVQAFTTGPTFAVGPLTLSMNAFGGLLRWQSAPGEEVYLVGGTPGDNEAGLGSSSGTGLISAHVIIEEQ